MKKISSDLIFTMNGPSIKSGTITINDQGVISEISDRLDEDATFYPGAICPGFINTHCHLELSHLLNKVPRGTGLPGFIHGVQDTRQSSEIEINNAQIKADKSMFANGIDAVGDISNGDSTIATKQSSPIHYHSFIEVFGFAPERAKSAMERAIVVSQNYRNANLPSSMVPHAPYSISTELFELLQDYMVNEAGLVTIHNQETPSENEMFLSGSGDLLQALGAFGNNIADFTSTGLSSLQSVLKYLPASPSLFVHNTFTTATDIEVAKSKNPDTHWCLCPKANLYIEGQLPNINLIGKEENVTIGTDSLASNDKLCVLDEIRTIQEHFNTPTETLLKWATINGASYLGIDAGQLVVGSRPGILHLNTPESLALHNNVSVNRIQ